MPTGEQLIQDLLHPFQAAMDAEKITSASLARKLSAELSANTTKFFAHEGRVVSKRTCVDWTTRQKARMDAHRLRGDYPAEKIEHSGTVNVNATMTNEELMSAITDLTKLLAG